MTFQYPNITEGTPTEQIVQLKSFLFKLVEQLNLGEVKTVTVQTGNAAVGAGKNSGSGVQEPTPAGSFNQIKSLIIKSADIVKAFEETVMKNFNSTYFAESDFGTYLNETQNQIEYTSKRVTENFTKVETITGTLGDLEADVRITNTYIKRGELDDGVYGLEIGETTEDGVFRKYARFTSEKLSFHDINDNEVAYIGAGTADKDDTKCLYITGKAGFEGDVKVGGYKMDTTDGLAVVWVG